MGLKVWATCVCCCALFRRRSLAGSRFPAETSLDFFELERPRAPKKSIAFQSVLVRYSLGMPETSLSGRNTRIARNVRRSISRCMPCENAVMILPQKHTHPATLYYLLLYYTNTHAKYTYTTSTRWLTSVPSSLARGDDAIRTVGWMFFMWKIKELWWIKPRERKMNVNSHLWQISVGGESQMDLTI